jgi:hypothetical protein
MDLVQGIGTDGALLFLSALGLAATTVAIFVDTRGQRTQLAKQPVRLRR